MSGKQSAVTALAVSLLLVACGQLATPSTDPVPTSTTAPGTTEPSPTTTTLPSTTATGTPVLDEAEGSGCTPGQGELGDGRWFGFVLATTSGTVEFDLACWFTGDAAVRAAAEDGEESPPPNDYYVRNVNETARTLDVAADATVIWYPQVGDPTSESTTTYQDWLRGIEEREIMLGVWLDVDDGAVVSIHEQWVP
ncbi:MAG: hypothetical protein ACRDVL_00045 [Acidimicrobiia bacterium]